MLLTDNQNLLSLYNALNGAEYSKPEELIITTLEDVIYLKLKTPVYVVFYLENDAPELLPAIFLL